MSAYEHSVDNVLLFEAQSTDLNTRVDVNRKVQINPVDE